MTTNEKKFDYAMRTLLYCDDDNITIPHRLHWSNLSIIKGISGKREFMNLLKNSLGKGIIFLHKYMVVNNVQEELATMPLEEWEKVDCYLISSIYQKQKGSMLPPPPPTKRG